MDPSATTSTTIDLLSQYPQYAQLVSVGFFWISFHCAGMCGPLVLGLDLGGHGEGGEGRSRTRAAASSRLGSASVNLLLYQCGRSITFAAMGALAGWGGQVLQGGIEQVTRVTGLVMAGVLMLAGAASLLGRTPGGDATWSGRLGRALGVLAHRIRSGGGRLRKLYLGIVLGFLPCMIPVWALGLAASTQSVLHGALIMVLLVWLTSGVIFGFGLAPSMAHGRTSRIMGRLLPLLLFLSGIWMGLISAGANGWIDHLSLGFTLGGEGYAIMFW